MQLPRMGDLFEDRYEIINVLGKGAFATVFLARDQKAQREIALKIIVPREGEYNDQVLARFQREGRLVAGLQDPHAVTLYDFGRSSTGLLFMVFEYVAGEDLAHILYRRGPFDPDTTIHILLQLLSVLREAHGFGILHRDIKPANILVFEYGGDPYNVKLLDFGVAKSLEGTKITKTGHLVGTPRYMSPEQVLGRDVSPATDIYSLALVGVELLTARPAVAGDSKKEVMKRHVTGPELGVPPNVAPGGLAGVLNRMLNRAPAGRYQSADEVISALRHARAQLQGWEPADPANPPDTARLPAMIKFEDPSSADTIVDQQPSGAMQHRPPNHRVPTATGPVAQQPASNLHKNWPLAVALMAMGALALILLLALL